MKRSRGFTLIELLVVIAIIAILAAILFPVFAKAREKARQSQCMSNMKNLALALRMYSSDYDEKLPFGNPNIGGVLGWPQPNQPGNPGTCTWEYSCGWAYASQPYIKNQQVLNCPNYARAGGPFTGCAGGGGPYPVFAGPGGTRFWLATTYELSSSLVGASESQIQHAANKAMLYEILPYHTDGNINAPNCAPPDSLYRNPAKPGKPVIIGFADGHTKVLNMNTAVGNQTLPNGCGPNPPATDGGMGIPRILTETAGMATKWNLNAGWDPASAPNFGCVANGSNDSPFGTTGRQGINF